MNPNELSTLMRGATNDLEPTPDFARQVLLGSRRRRTRRRLTMAASAAVVAAIAAVTSVVVLDDNTPHVADARLTAPTKGDLAGDQTFLGEATSAWRNGLSIAPEAALGVYDDRRGDPHVYWAGNTPAGRAAIVLQEVYVHDEAQVPDSETGRRTAEGLIAVDPRDGKLKLVGTRVVGEEQLGRADYYKFGPDDRTLLIVDEGKPLYYTYRFAYELSEYGVVESSTLEWHRAEPRDGVALVRIPENVNGIVTVAYQGNHPPAKVDWAAIPHDFYVRRMAMASRYLARRIPSPDFRTSFLPWKQTWEVGAPLGLSPAERDRLRGRDDNLLLGGPDYVSAWVVFARLDDGRTVALQETQNRTGMPELTVLVIRPPDNTTTMDNIGSVGSVGAADQGAVLPVRFRIPSGGGWIVADKGKQLSYRTAPDGDWQDAGRDAALLPDNATEVKVDGETVALS